ncbi:hypothetical protein [Nocardia sp. NPDC004711]
MNLSAAYWLAGEEELGVDLVRQGIGLRREIGDTAAGELTGLTLVGLARWITTGYATIADLYEESAGDR